MGCCAVVEIVESWESWEWGQLFLLARSRVALLFRSFVVVLSKVRIGSSDDERKQYDQNGGCHHGAAELDTIA